VWESLIAYASGALLHTCSGATHHMSTSCLAEGSSHTVLQCRTIRVGSLVHWCALCFLLQGAVQVLVASDAIGMGVNLNLRRVIFHALRTFNPKTQGLVKLDPSRIKQIAGVPILQYVLRYSCSWSRPEAVQSVPLHCDSCRAC
jgi:hypothetical protein